MAEEKDFSKQELPDKGSGEVCSGANEFQVPQYEITADPGKGTDTSSMFEAFFSQRRRSG